METVFPVVETTGSATLTVVSFQQTVVPGTTRVPRASLAISAAKIEMDSPGNHGVWRAGRARSQGDSRRLPTSTDELESTIHMEELLCFQTFESRMDF